MVRLSDKVINDVRNKADISEIIGHYIPLIKKGKSLTAVCPFHDDHNPSLSISSDKQIYKCFVCGNGGNVFTFVQNFEKTSFIDAVIKVAEHYHIDLGIKSNDLESDRYDEQTRNYFKILNEAIAFQQYQLNSEQGKDILAYLKKRGYDESIIKEFMIGYNPSKDNLTKFLKAKGYIDKDLVALNLSRLDDDHLTDVFADRITFPIFDRFGSPIAFTARTTVAGFEPKYINSTETKLYTKSNVLYNYHKALNTARKEHLVFVVEGVTDVIALFKAGFSNVIATLGTAMSKQQIQLIKQLTLNVVLCYDGDKAGQAANYKNGKLLSEVGLNVSIIANDTQKDPDDIIRDEGVDRLKAILAKRYNWIEFVMDHLSINYDLHNYSQKKAYALEIIKEISKLKDRFDQETFLKKLATLTEFDQSLLSDMVKGETKTVAIVKERPQYPVHKKMINGRLRAEYEILSQLLNSMEACNFFIEQIGFLPTDINNQLAMLILEYVRRNEKIEVADFISYIDNDELKDLTLNLIDWEYLPKDFNKNALFDAYNKIKISLIDEQVLDLKRQQNLKTAMDDKRKITNEILRLKKERNSIQDSLMKEEV